MLNKAKSLIPESQNLQLFIIIIIYCTSAYIFGLAHRHDVNPDILAYLRLAGYIVEGNWQQSVTGYWAPLITWCLAPFLYLGLDGVVTARVVVALGGLGAVLAGWLLSQRFVSSERIRFIVVLISSLLVSNWTVHNPGLNPDLILVALLMCYFYLVSSEKLLHDKRTAFMCGLIGGVSYLSKHYALPFFLAHFSLMLFLRACLDRGGQKVMKRVVLSFVIGVTGLCIMALPWILLISSKYERFVISTSGKLNHALLSPDNKIKENYGNPGFYGLHKPDSQRAIHIWEDPAQIAGEYTVWSPFESKEYFIYQVKVWKRNLRDVLNYLAFKSPFFLYISTIGVLFLNGLAFFITAHKKVFLYWFTLSVFLVYPLGYILVNAANARYFYPVMMLAVLISFHFFEELINYLKDKGGPERSRMALAGCLLVLFVSAFAFKPALNLFNSFRFNVTTKGNGQYMEVVRQLRSVDFQSPYATIGSVESVFRDIHIAYYLEKQLLGRVLASDLEGITRELRTAQAKSLVVINKPEIAAGLREDDRYTFIAAFKKDPQLDTGHDINVFSLVQEPGFEK